MRKVISSLALFAFVQAGCVVSPATQLASLDASIERNANGTVVGVDLSRGLYVPVAGGARSWTVVGDPLLRNGTVANSHMTAIRDFKDLTSLRLTGTEVTGAALFNLQDPQKLRTLELSATRLSDEELPIVGAIKNLTELRLSGTSISDDGLRHLIALEKLEILAIDNTPITDRGLAILLQLKSLRTIYVRDTRISLIAIQEAKKTRPQLNIVAERPIGGVI